jgi:transcriptional regulator with AAA-type ATPase domain/tetratricopeptide (TPR) repeat protein
VFGEEGFRHALREAEALFGLRRYRDALGVVTRALARRPPDADLTARLRIVRAHALWTAGRVAPARAEVRKAEGEAREALTRGRLGEALALFARKARDLETARRHLQEARSWYAGAGSLEGEVRVLEKEIGAVRDGSGFEHALVLAEERIRLAERSTRIDARAAAHNDRGDLLGALGRWREARAELDEAATLYRSVGDPRELILAGTNRAVLDIAAGELAAARQALLAADQAMGGSHDDPRGRGEVLLAWADLHLAAGGAAESERSAAEALGRFAFARDALGECRSRIRRSHALLGLDRPAEALREARRAVRAASRRDIEAFAEMTLGRVLLRSRPVEARHAFERSLALCNGASGCAHAARLGRALARGAAREDDDVRLAIQGLEMWGDRRLLAACLTDMGRLRGSVTASGALGRAAAAPTPLGYVGKRVVDAALALAGEGEWGGRWSAAMRALLAVLPWSRAALVCEDGWELRHDLEAPVPLAADDLAAELAGRAKEPLVVDLADGAWRSHPVRVLHGLASAAVVPLAPGRALYFDRKDGLSPLSVGELSLAVDFGRLLASHWPPAAAVEPSTARFPEIVGECPAMEALFNQMASVAGSDIRVHIVGETGTGKERVAQALHARSPRSQRPFVALNASSLSDELFEAELFGHVRGAFTGAVAEREGYVARAEGGTLFVDEVADLTPRAQAKLLRFLAEGEYRRLGETELRRGNVRVLTAANVSLRERAAQGHFREDLMYRLTSMTLTLPPLRERGGDILLLARHFLRRAAARAGRPAPQLPRDVAQALLEHPWPGNIRELESEIERLLVLAGNGPLSRGHLSQYLAGAESDSRGSLKVARIDFERRHIAVALGQNRGNRARTALQLGITRQGLVAKLKKLGL